MAYQSRLELVVDSRTGERNLRSFSGELGRAERAGNLTTAAMTKLKGAIGLAAAAAGGFSFQRIIRETAQFDDAMRGLQAVSRATAQQMGALEKQARTLGATSMFSAREAADAQRFLAQAGLEVNEVLSATPGVLRLATAANMDLAQAADIASNVLGGMRLEVAELDRVMDVLAATAAGANTDVSQLGQALSFAAPIAANAGVSIEQAAAAIGVLSDAGLQASRAGTGLVGVIRQLSNVTPAAAAALQGYGLSVEDVNVEAHGLEEVLDRLQGANISTADAFNIFGSEAGAAAQILANGSGRVREFTSELRDSEGAASAMADIIGGGLSGSMASFSSALSESIIRLGRDEGLASGFQAVLDTATGVMSVYNGMADQFAEINGLTDTQVQRLETLASGLQTVGMVATAAIGGRLVGALGSAALAKAAATQQSIAYQMALARMAGASATATAAAGALRGALMLVGGPLGLLIGVGGLLYVFRDELGLTIDKVGLTEAELASLREEMAEMSEEDLGQSLDSLNHALDEATLKAAAAREELAALRGESRGSGVLGFGAGEVGAEVRGIQAVAEATTKIAEIEQKLEAAREERRSRRKGDFKSLDEWLFKLEETDEETETLTKTVADAASGSDDFARSLAQLRNRLQPARAAQIQMAQSMNTLSLAYASGRINLQEYLDLVWLLQEANIESADTAEDAADRISYSFQTWEEVALNTVRRVDNAGQDLWLGFIDGSRNALDTVKRFFQQTLAEIAHMLTTQRLTVAVGGALGIGGSGAAMAGGGGAGGIGGLSGLWGGARSLIGGNQFGSGISDIGRAISPTGDMGNWFSGAGQYANWQYGLAGIGGGLVGNMFGGHGGIGGSLGSTIGMAAGGPIGAVVGTVLGGALGSLFGGSSSSPELNLRTVATGTMPSGGTGWEHHGGAYTSGVFGDIGFADRGTSRLSKQFPDGEHEFLEAIAGMDAMMASLAQSEEQFKAMESAARSWSARAGGPQGIVDQLSDRTATILGALDGEFGKFVRSLDGGLEEVVAQALTAREALALLESSQDRLNLTFESAADGAYSASFAIAELAGGLDNLSAMQEAYYQAYFSEAERAAHLQDDLTQSLSSMGMQLPDTRDGFRALVEAQDLNSEAGQRNYVALLQLAGGFDQLQQMAEGLGGALSGVDLSGVRSAYEQLQSSIAAEQEILRSAHQATTRSIRDNMRTVQNAMRDTERLARGLQNALDGMLRQGGDLAASRSGAQSYLRSVLASGGLGDPRELERALQVVSEPSEGLFSSFEDYQRDFWTTANIVDQLNDRASEQLTTEERSLRALERQLEQADRQFELEMARLDGVLERQTAMLEAEFGQLDWLQTINGSVLSMSDAIAALGGAIRSAQAAQRDTAAVRASAPSSARTREEILAGALYNEANPDVLAAVREGVFDTPREHYEKYGRSEGREWPQFATGGIASGPMSGYPVELHGTEAVIPLNGSSIPLNVPGIQALVREVSELRRELAASQRAIAEHTRKSARVLERESMERRQEEVV